MGTTDNGYSAPPHEGIRPCGWDGAFAAPGVKDWDPVYDVFQYLMREFDERVEWLRPGWCWGYAFRANANDPNSLSRHSGAIAVDLNAPLHPNGVPTSRVFTPAQITTINNILDEIICPLHNHRVLRWGGDYTGTPDGMHFEINVAQACVVAAAANLNEKEFNMDDQTKAEMRTLLREALQPVKEASIRQTQRIMSMLRDQAERDASQAKMLRALVKDMRQENAGAVVEEADRLEARAKAALDELDKMESQPEH